MSQHVLTVTVEPLGDRHRVSVEIAGELRAVAVARDHVEAVRSALLFAAGDVLDDIASGR